MKKTLLLMLTFLGVSIYTLTAQEYTNCIVVETTDGAITYFSPSSVNRLYIEDGSWVFEMKDSNLKFSYAFEDVLPFTIKLHGGTDIQQLNAQSNWRICDDGNHLTIENPNGIIGSYTVYDIHGRVLKSDYSSESKVAINGIPGNLYIVKVNGKSKKVFKK